MTLNQTAKLYRSVLKIAAILIGIVVILRVSLSLLGLIFSPSSLINSSQAEAKFGKLPPLVIQRAEMRLVPNYITKLDLVRAELPQQPQIAKVFPVLKAPYGFLSEDRANSIAKQFKFDSDPIKTNDVERVWLQELDSLSVNSQTLNFRYKYNYQADPNVLVKGNIPTQNTVIDRTFSVIESLNVIGGYANDLKKDTAVVYLIKDNNGTLQPAINISEASAARVDFRRADVVYELSKGITESFPFVSPTYVGSLTYIITSVPEVTRKSQTFKTIEGNFVLWRYLPASGSTYQVISSRDAWENIQTNPALFTVFLGNRSLGPIDALGTTPTIESFTATDAFFAFYNSDIEQDYIQPVWVFTGKAGLNQGGELDWAAYVPAVNPSFIQTDQATTTP